MALINKQTLQLIIHIYTTQTQHTQTQHRTTQQTTHIQQQQHALKNKQRIKGNTATNTEVERPHKRLWTWY